MWSAYEALVELTLTKTLKPRNTTIAYRVPCSNDSPDQDPTMLKPAIILNPRKLEHRFRMIHEANDVLAFWLLLSAKLSGPPEQPLPPQCLRSRTGPAMFFLSRLGFNLRFRVSRFRV